MAIVLTPEQREFAESMSEVVACWMATYVVLERITEFHDWLVERPHLWPMFTSVPDEEAMEGGVQVFIDATLERAQKKMLEKAAQR